MSLLALKNLSIEISNTCVCRDLSLGINPGEVWSVLGRNGVGKSTLLKTVAGLRTPVSGQIILDDQEVMNLSRRSRAQRLGILFQENETLFPASVLDTVLTGRHPWLNPLQGESVE
ncbi:MAG TPA: ABC transporter, partial [Gammaproteobacteria bacterium]|nr:ABC transporter [Gammaproteobacteria bacterium]